MIPEKPRTTDDKNATLRDRIVCVGRLVGPALNEGGQKPAADTCIVRTSAHLALHKRLKTMKAQLQDHYERCSGPMHSYTMVLQGNVVLDGILLRDMPITCEVKSAINCRLGQATTLNCSAASHSALRSLIIARFGGMFFNRKFRMECIVQSR